MSKISEALVESRKHLHMTKTFTAKQIGIKQSNYAEWESGAVKPNKKYWSKINRVLGIDLMSDEFIPNRLFMMVDPNCYSLPVAVADSAKELSEITGYPAKMIREHIAKKCSTFVEVILDDDI